MPNQNWLREKVGCKLNADVGFFVKVNQVEINVSRDFQGMKA